MKFRSLALAAILVGASIVGSFAQINVGVSGSPAVDDCMEWAGGGKIRSAGAACGSGGGGVAVGDITGLGTGVATWLATPSTANLAAAVTGETGSGAAVFGTSPTLVTPALGTPSAVVLTNGTGLPIGGLTGLGTGVGTALAVNVGSAGAPVLFNGALGTPSSGTLTSATGLPVSTGISGLGTGVATALAVNTGSAGAPVLFNGAGGTPSSLTLTNATALPNASVTGLGTAALVATGTSGATIPLLNGVNTWSGGQTLSATTAAGVTVSGTRNNTSAKFITITGGLTGTASGNSYDATQTWNTTGAPSAFFANITDTASDAASKLLDLQVGSASKINVAVKTPFTTTIAGPIDNSAATGGQLVFPASQNASAGVNTLDDYEEGTWTPVLTVGTPGDLTVVLSVQVGKYTKIGRMVTAQFNLTTSTWTWTTASGNAQITGLPFTSSSTGTQNGTLRWQGITKAGYTQCSPTLSTSTTQLTINCSGSGLAAQNAAAADMPTAGSVILQGTITYFID